MKTLPFLLSVAMCCAVLGAAGSMPAPLGLVPNTFALWQFDEGSGTAVTDSSGNGNTATLAGGTLPTWTAGQFGMALDFSNWSSQLILDDGIEVGEAWTIQGWTRFPSSGGGWREFASYSAGSIHVVLSGNILGVYEGGFYSCGYNVSSLTGWHLLSAVGSGTQTTFYVDDAQVGVSPHKVKTPVWNLCGAAGEGWNGSIDSMRIVGVARTAAEIEDDFNNFVAPPDAPGSPGQFSLAGASITSGGQAVSGFVVNASVSGGAPVHHLEVEAKPAGVAFNETGLVVGADVPDGPATVSVTGLATGPWHWRVRTVDEAGSSPWVAFGAGGTDILMVANSAPTSGPAAQVLASDATPIVSTRYVFDTERVRLEAVVSDPEADNVMLQIELRPGGSSFPGQPTMTSAPVPSGEMAVCEVTLAPGSYSWRYRAVDAPGAMSAWVSFGGSIVVKSAGSSGVGACGASACAGNHAIMLALIGFVGLLRRRA